MSANSQVNALSHMNLDQIETIHDSLLNRRLQLSSPLEGTSELWKDVIVFLEQVRCSGTFLDRPRDRRAAQGILDYWASALVRAGKPVPDVRLDVFDVALAPKLRDETPCPYQGLEAFTEERSDYFFGRESLLDDIVHRIKAGQPIFLVSGASGSGKSSLLRAGLIPRLRRGGDIQGSEGWCYVTMVPGDNPMHSLDEALRGCGDASRGDDTSRSADADITAVSNQGARLLIMVDQFEEVFTLGNEVSRNEFVGHLYDSAQKNGALVFMTVRDDYVDDLQKLPEAYSSWARDKDARILVEALSLPELQSAIEGPAEKVGLRFDDGIVDDLAGKVLGQTAGLPLLQFTLLRLWDEIDRNRITKDNYAAVGDPLTSLQKCANGFYEHLIPEAQNIVRQIFAQRLVNINEGVEPTRKRTELKGLFDLKDPASPQAIAGVLVQLICEARLIKLSSVPSSPCAAIDRDSRTNELLTLVQEPYQSTVPQIEVAHEALIRNWELLRGWIRDERDGMQTRWDLARATNYWNNQGKPENALYTGSRLDCVIEEKYPDLSEEEEEFITKSKRLRADQEGEVKRRDRREKQMRQAIVVMAFVLVICIAATFALVSYRSLRQSVFEIASMLIDSSVQKMNSDTELSILLSAEALDRALSLLRIPVLDSLVGITATDLGNFERSVRDAISNKQNTMKLPLGAESTGMIPPRMVSISPDGQWIAAASGGIEPGASCEVHLWSLPAEETDSPTLYWSDSESVCVQPIRMLHFDRDSTRLAVVHTGGVIDRVLLDASAPESERENIPRDGEGVPEVLAWSPTGRWLVVGDRPGVLGLIENSQPNEWIESDRSLVTARSTIATTQFSPNENWFASLTVSGTLNLWNLLEPTEMLSVTLPVVADQIAFDPGSRWLAVAASTACTVALVDLHSIDQRGVLPGCNGGTAVHSLAFQQRAGSDTTFLAVGYEDGAILLWDLNTLGVHSPSQPASDAPDQGSPSALETPAQVGDKQDWPELAIGEPIGIYEHSDALDQLAFSAEAAHRLISVGMDGTVYVWEVANRRPELRGTLHGGEKVPSAFFDPRGSRRVYVMDWYMLRYWQDDPPPEHGRDLLRSACLAVEEPLTPLEERRYLAAEDEDYVSACEKVLQVDNDTEGVTEVPK